MHVTLNVIVLELSLIGGAVAPRKLSLTLLLPVSVLSCISGTIRPSFGSITMLEIGMLDTY